MRVLSFGYGRIEAHSIVVVQCSGSRDATTSSWSSELREVSKWWASAHSFVGFTGEDIPVRSKVGGEHFQEDLDVVIAQVSSFPANGPFKA